MPASRLERGGLTRSELITIKDLSAWIPLPESTLATMARRGELPGFKLASTWLFRVEDIEKMLADRVAANSGRGGGDSDD